MLVVSRPPNHWSAGVVAALGDVLAVLPADVLASIRVSSWKEAADTLAQRTVYHLPTHVHGSDYPLPFVDVSAVAFLPSYGVHSEAEPSPLPPGVSVAA